MLKLNMKHLLVKKKYICKKDNHSKVKQEILVNTDNRDFTAITVRENSINHLFYCKMCKIWI